MTLFKLFRHSAVVSLSALVLLLSGCFEFEQEIYLNADGSGRSTMRYAFPLSLAKGQMPGVQLQSDQPIPMNKDEVEKFFSLKPGIKLRNAHMQDSGQFRLIKLDLDFDNVAAMDERELRYELGVEGTQNVFRIRYGIDRKFAAKRVENELQRHLIKGMPGKGMTFRVYFPRKISDSNAEKWDANTAAWTLPMSFLMDPDRGQKTFEARYPATRYERGRYWLKSLFK